MINFSTSLSDLTDNFEINDNPYFMKKGTIHCHNLIKVQLQNSQSRPRCKNSPSRIGHTLGTRGKCKECKERKGKEKIDSNVELQGVCIQKWQRFSQRMDENG